MPLNDSLHYWIARSGQTFGPYTTTELREYVRAGNIMPSDYLRSEEDGEWTTVGQALGLAAAPPMPISGGMTGAPTAPEGPAHGLAVTSLVLAAVGLLCCGFFASVPGIVVALMALRKPPESARTMAIWGLILNIISTIISVVLIFIGPLIMQSIMGGMNVPGGGL